MQVDDLILKSVGFIGNPSAGGLFAVEGTGFFVVVSEEEFDFIYLVSAKHVVWPEGKKRDAVFPPQGDIHLRLNRKVGEPKLIKTARNTWFYHKDRFVDLCAFPVPKWDYWEELDIAHLTLSSIFHSASSRILPMPIYLGEEVFITGAFVGRVGERTNIPVVRLGSIAAMPLEPIDFASPRHPAYLIEARSLGGLSGSPVFLNFAEPRSGRRGFGPPRKNLVASHEKRQPDALIPYRVLGMMIGAHGGDYSSDFISETDTDIRPARSDMELNSGMAVVLPDSQIEDFLNSAEIKGFRMAHIEARRSNDRADQ